MREGAPCDRAGRRGGRGRKAGGEAATCAACAAPGDASQASDGDGDGGSRRKSRGGGGVASRHSRCSARGRRLCAAAALSGLRPDRRRGSAILLAMLVVARFPRRSCLRFLLDPVAVGATRLADGVWGLSRQPAAVRWSARRRRLWRGGADRRVAAQIWAADRACPVDGPADGKAARGTGRAGGHVAGAGPAASLAALVARVQPGGTGSRRAGADYGRPARSSPAVADAGDRVAARQGAKGTRTHRRRRVRARTGREIAHGGPESGTDRRCPCQRCHPARGGAGFTAQRRRASLCADVGAGRSRRAAGGQHI